MCPEDYNELTKFHGHSCPGLAIGYRAVKAAVGRTHFQRAGDEELIAIVENDSCSVDAVQFLLGCTFGKGNLIFRDYGKQVFTFAGRTGEKTVRVSLRSGALAACEVFTEQGTRRRMKERKVDAILSIPEEELFKVEDVSICIPERARIHSSVPCDLCGEPTMETRIVEKGRKACCIPCGNRHLNRTV